jgi:hypothetical protein
VEIWLYSFSPRGFRLKVFSVSDENWICQIPFEGGAVQIVGRLIQSSVEALALKLYGGSFHATNMLSISSVLQG